MQRFVDADAPVDLTWTVGTLRHLGLGDPGIRFVGKREVHRAAWTPDGPSTVRVREEEGGYLCDAWGAGAAWELERMPALLGLDDVPSLPASHRVTDELLRRFPGVRINRSSRVFETLVPTILGQRITVKGARRSYRGLALALGEPAPGPLDLVLPPRPEKLVAMPYHAFHRFDIEQDRAVKIRRVAAVVKRMEEAASMQEEDAFRRLTAVPGIGPWTAGHVLHAALGFSDAVPLGDYHLPNTVAWALAREERGTEARMLELLAPFAGQRGRVVKLLIAGGIAAPRRGPRARSTTFRHRES